MGRQREAAFDKELSIGSEIPWLDGTYRVVCRIDCADWWSRILRNRQIDAIFGRPAARAGIVKIDDEGNQPAEFIPTRERPPGLAYCYVLEKCETSASVGA
jgi:hypothetical protein